QAGGDERLRQASARQVGPHAEPEPHLVSLGDEVEEADELAVVVDDRAQVRSSGGVREQLDASRVGRRVVPLVRKLVAPLGDRGPLLVGDGLDLHGMEPMAATQRAAAPRPRRAASSSDPPTRKPAASASPAPVGSTTSVSRAAKSSFASSVRTVHPRAPRLSTPTGAVRYAPPSSSHSASVAKRMSGASSSSSSRNCTGP